MRDVIENLKAKEILSEKNIFTLKQYIEMKYPQYTQEKRSAVFADAIHKTLDGNLQQFTDKHRESIRINAFKRALASNTTSINGSQLLEACLALEIKEEAFTEAMTAWINQNQSITLSKEIVDDFTRQIYENISLFQQKGIDELVKIIDQSQNNQQGIIDNPLEDNHISSVDIFQDSDNQNHIQQQTIFLTSSYNNSKQAKTSNPISSEYIYSKKYKIMIEARKLLIHKGKDLILSIIECFNKYRANKGIIISLTIIMLFLSTGAVVYTTQGGIVPGDKGSVVIKSVVMGEKLGLSELEEEDAKNQEKKEIRFPLGLWSWIFNADETIELMENELPQHLKYIDVDIPRLKLWLEGRNSLLGEEPYISAIVEVAREFNINPLLLFAIVGQEQGFVPRHNEYAQRIANNPFNVFGSWVEYNTDIHDSSRIAARTVIHLSKDRPQDKDAIKWINRRYAEDPEWWKGVSWLFNKLVEDVMGEGSR